MAKFDVMGSQNVEVSEKLPCEKPLLEQLAILSFLHPCLSCRRP